MAHLSRGGLSYPDFQLGLSFLLCVCVSTVLNPIVIHHNRRPTSIPKVMFLTVAVTNLMMAPYVGIHTSFKILKPEESPYFNFTSGDKSHQLIKLLAKKHGLQGGVQGELHTNATYRMPHYCYCHEAGTFVKVFGALVWIFIAIPSFLTGLHTCVRYLQIRYPFWPIEKRKVTILITSYIVYLTTYQCCIMINRSMHWYWCAQIQTTWFQSGPSDRIPEIVGITYFAPCMIVECVAVIASFLTSYQLCAIKKTNLSQNQRRNVRGTAKILLENALNILCLVTQLSAFISYAGEPTETACRMLTLDPVKLNEGSVWQRISFTVGLPVLSCAIHPCIYIALTPKSVQILTDYKESISRQLKEKIESLGWWNRKIRVKGKSAVSSHPTKEENATNLGCVTVSDMISVETH